MPSHLPHKLALILAALAIALPSEALAQRHGGNGGGWQGGGGRGYHPGSGGGRAGRDGYRRNSGYHHNRGDGGHRRYGGYRGYGGYGGYGGYRGYGGYSDYYGYGGYGGHYYRNRHNNHAWIAVGAGLLGVVLGSVMGQRRSERYERYDYPQQAPQQTAPAMQQCPDGSTIPVGSYCQAPPPAAPSQSLDERG